MAMDFLAIPQPFFGWSNWIFSWIFKRMLSIDWSWEIVIPSYRYFFEKVYFWRENERGRQTGLKGSWALRSDQNVGSPGGTVMSTVISNSKKPYLKSKKHLMKMNAILISILISIQGQNWQILPPWKLMTQNYSATLVLINIL